VVALGGPVGDPHYGPALLVIAAETKTKTRSGHTSPMTLGLQRQRSPCITGASPARHSAVLSGSRPGKSVVSFRPFQRLASHPTDAAEGLGLGLAIVHAIADAHKAVVTAQAQPAAASASTSAFPRLHVPARPPQRRPAGSDANLWPSASAASARDLSGQMSTRKRVLVSCPPAQIRSAEGTGSRAAGHLTKP